MTIYRGGFTIAKIHQLGGRIMAKKLKELGVEEINQAQGRILFFLWQNDGVPIQEVSRLTGLEKSTLTSMLDRLEAAGHIYRETCSQDRRRTLVRVAQQSSPLRSGYQQAVGQMIEAFYQGFSPQEIHLFEEMLERIYTNLVREELNT